MPSKPNFSFVPNAEDNDLPIFEQSKDTANEQSYLDEILLNEDLPINLRDSEVEESKLIANNILKQQLSKGSSQGSGERARRSISLPTGTIKAS